MKVHGLCVVKNEGDIIERSLTENSRWCDFIYVFDTGSTDDTWERVCHLAKANPNVVPFKNESVPFDDALRACIFNHFKDRAIRGDWWCRLDADEIYVDDPREFLTNRVPSYCHVVWSKHIQFYFTEKDEAKNAGELPRYYRADYSEPRFFRHRPGLQWTSGAWPAHLGLVAPERIRLKHYQYRSPAQIQRRLDTRREAAAQGWQHFPNSQVSDWHEKIIPSSTLHFDVGDGHYVIDEEKMPPHMERGWQRIVKRVLHGTGVWP